MTSNLRLPLFGLAACGSLLISEAQTGIPDPTFQPAYPGSVLELLVDGQGRVVVANEATFNSVVPLLDRILPDGRRDPTFQAVMGVSYIRTIALCPDGRILVSRDRADQDPPLVCSLKRLHVDGSVDLSFQPCGNIPQYIDAVLVQADGRIVVAGWSRNGMVDTPALIRLLEDGSMDPTFQADLHFAVNLLTLQPDGRILAAGAVSPTGGSAGSHLRLVRLRPDGAVDASFAALFDDSWGWATAQVLQPDGKLLLAAVIRAPREPHFDYESRLIRLDADGRLDGSFVPARQASGQTVILQGDGKVLIGSTNHLYRLEADGRLDASFGVASDPESLEIGPGWMHSLQLLGDGSVMVAGSFHSYLDTAGGSVLRLHNDGGVGAGKLQWTASQVATPEAAGTLALQVTRIDGNRGEVLVNYATHGGSARAGQRYESGGGVIRFADGESGPKAVNIRLINNEVGESDQTFLVSLANPIGGAMLGDPAQVEVTVINDDTSVRFQSPSLAVREEAGVVDVVIERGGLLGGSSSVRAQVVEGTARAGIDYQAAPALIEFGPGQSHAVYRLTLLDDPWAEGDRTLTVVLSNATGAVIEPGGLAVTLIDGDAPGRVDPLFDPVKAGWSVNREVFSWFLLPDSGDSVIAAAVAYVGPLELTGLVRFRTDGSVDPEFGLGRPEMPLPPTESVTRMVRLGSGRLLAAKGSGGVVAVSASGDLEPAFPGDLWTGWVNSMLAAPGDQVLLQGDLYRKDNESEHFALARLNSDGTRDLSFRSPIFGQSPDGSDPSLVSTVAWAADGSGVLVGGSFSLVDAQPRTGLARLLPDGRLDSAFVVSIEREVGGVRSAGEVSRMAVPPDGHIYIAGDFSLVQGVRRRGLARLKPDGLLDTTFDQGAGFSLVWPLPPSSLAPIACLLPMDNGRLLVGGWFEQVQGQRVNHLVRLNADGSLDRTFATFSLPPHDPHDMAPWPGVFSIAPATDGRVWIAGSFGTYDGLPRPGVARINNGNVLQLVAVQPGGVPGSLALELWLPAAGTYELEASNDLRQWVKVGERTLPAGKATWAVATDGTAGSKFYRLRRP